MAEVNAALLSRGRADLAEQLSVAEVSKVTFDAEADADYVYMNHGNNNVGLPDGIMRTNENI